MYKCECCELEIENIPKWKECECPEDIYQHHFKQKQECEKLVKSWKKELDVKYDSLMNMGDSSIMNKANDVILKAIENRDKVLRECEKNV